MVQKFICQRGLRPPCTIGDYSVGCTRPTRWLEAVRSVWNSNGDGKLTVADTEFAKFKVLVTNADGTTIVQTLPVPPKVLLGSPAIVITLPAM